MLALVGRLAVLALLGAIPSRRVSPLVASIGVPIATALAGGSGHGVGGWVTTAAAAAGPRDPGRVE
jgi:CitMHS family citrate-Mg2+:H+ or citrate-Ca2+:H+ symporter